MPPIPTPGKDEEKGKFISRCMGNPTMVKDYKQAQRAAICYAQWDKKKGRKKSKGGAEIIDTPIGEVVVTD